jgi:DNA repair and recombination protein RAD54 and RAD54-like protein
LTPLQEALYTQLIKHMDKELHKQERATGSLNKFVTLAFITNLKKLCNHPQLIWDKCQARESGFGGESAGWKRLIWH